MSDHLPVPVEPTPLLLIQQALDAKISPADMKDLFELQRMHAADIAERAYADAITAFQAECPPICKTADNQGTKKKYATYEHIMRTILPILRKHRIVISWDTKDDNDKMFVICRVRVGTVEKLTTVAMPTSAASTKMNDQQASGGAVTYGRRYAIVAALNLFDTDEDTDGQLDTGYISQQQEDELDGLLSELATLGWKIDLDKFCKWLGAQSLATIPASQHLKAVNDLRNKIETHRKAGAK